MWTTDRIVQLLNTSDRAVERAVVAIYQRQTADEQAASVTCHDNTVGFSGCDAIRGSYWARLIMRGYHLYPDKLAKARKMVVKYRRQLTEIANAKETGR
jgi:hypothetical protein